MEWAEESDDDVKLGEFLQFLDQFVPDYWISYSDSKETTFTWSETVPGRESHIVFNQTNRNELKESKFPSPRLANLPVRTTPKEKSAEFIGMIDRKFKTAHVKKPTAPWMVSWKRSALEINANIGLVSVGDDACFVDIAMNCDGGQIIAEHGTLCLFYSPK